MPSSGASSDEIQAAERALGCRLPPDYVAFVSRQDGFEDFLGSNYLSLMPVRELKATRDSCAVRELLCFGSDGAGEAFAFDTRSEPWGVVMVPWIGMALDTAIPVGQSFDDFLHRLATVESMFDRSR